MEQLETDLCIIGGGSGGLSIAAGAVQMGARVVLVEPGPMGGDCLNYGCVPSKALIAAARMAHSLRRAAEFGVHARDITVNPDQLADHIADVIAQIAPHDSVERFESLGVRVIQHKAVFENPRQVRAGDCQIRAKYFVIATGSTAMIPPIPGLDQVPYFTNETIFANREPVSQLLVMGGGPIGMEMAQAFRRLGAHVTVVEMFDCLAKDDPDCAAVVKQQFRDEGIRLCERHKVVRVEEKDEKILLHTEYQQKPVVFEGSHLIVATGRRPVLSELGLEAAGIVHDQRGIKVDSRLRTNHRHIYAIGDVIGGYQFTHAAGYHAGIVVRNILFRLPAKSTMKAMPWVTYTDPELAHVGESEATALTRLGDGQVRVEEYPFSGNDRATAERVTDGKIKVVLDRKGRVLGVDIVGPHAGELILPWQMMVHKSAKISQMASAITPYPTLSEISKRAAGQYFTPTLYSERVRKIVRFLLKLPNF